jgi:hypothetical protein
MVTIMVPNNPIQAANKYPRHDTFAKTDDGGESWRMPDGNPAYEISNQAVTASGMRTSSGNVG